MGEYYQTNRSSTKTSYSIERIWKVRLLFSDDATIFLFSICLAVLGMSACGSNLRHDSLDCNCLVK